MTQNKTQATPDSVQAFLSGVPAARRPEDCLRLCELMQKATGVLPIMWGSSIVGFGSERYAYDSGREGEQLVVGFSPRAQAIVIYGLLRDDQAAGRLALLGPVKRGKGCLYVRRLDDVDLVLLSDLVSAAFRAKR